MESVAISVLFLSVFPPHRPAEGPAEAEHYGDPVLGGVQRGGGRGGGGAAGGGRGGRGGRGAAGR